MPHVIGIDIAKRTFDIATLQTNGKYRTKAKLANTAAGFETLQQWLVKHSDHEAWIVMEATGTYKGQARISRTGSSRLRAGLYMPAVSSLKHNAAIRALRDRLQARGKTGKQIVCAAMRKLLSIAYGVLKSNQPFEPKLALAH